MVQHEHPFLRKPPGSGQAVPVHSSNRKIKKKKKRMLQFSRWFWSPNDWKPHQVLLLVMPRPNKWNTISLLQYNLQMNVQLPSWTKGLWHLLLTNQSTELSDSKIVLHVKAHKVLKLSGTFLSSLFSRLICQHYLSLLAWTSKSVWCLPKGRKLVCHDLSVTFFNPLGFRKRMHKSEKKTPLVWREVTVRSFKQVAVLLEEWWHALFTTRTDTFLCSAST